MAFQSRTKRIGIVVTLLTIICIALTTGLLIHFLSKTSPDKKKEEVSKLSCDDRCAFTLVESIPEGLNYPDNHVIHPPTGPTILNLIQSAQKTIHVASYYWSLQFNDTTPTDSSAKQGQDVFDALHNIGKQGKVQVKIVQNKPSRNQPDVDTQILAKYASVKVRTIDFTRLLGAGILHTKMWMVDTKDFYVGSANIDWRSFTQVKEMGVLVQNCTCLADDMDKIFQMYWNMAAPEATLPTTFSKSLSPQFNLSTPMSLINNKGDKNRGSVYLASSPPKFCPQGRTTDIDAILNVIHEAKDFVYVAVMDYEPAIVFSHPQTFWPVIDDALKSAAFDRNVTVKLLVSNWTHTHQDMFVFLHSLEDMSKMHWIRVSLEVKVFEVPSNATLDRIPYARVNHNKYMVTDRHAYIGTSNWSGDYFVATGGIGFVMEQTDTLQGSSNMLRRQLVDVFNRDWNSVYAHPLSG